MTADQRGLVIAIDGPAGAGKSTVAKGVADAMGLRHLDTGALYRGVTLAVLRSGADPTDPVECAKVATRIDIRREHGRTLLDGVDVESEIRGPEVTTAVSAVSAHPPVREHLIKIQRALADGGCVAEGRDIGTVVFPDADLKVFLDASIKERAARRAKEQGSDASDDIETELKARDDADAGREVAPLMAARDAWHLDTTVMELTDVVDAIVARARSGARPHTIGPVIVVAGRPNVGKSTLVNRIIGRRTAIVEPLPGVTRDRTEHDTVWSGTPLRVVDTGGWMPNPEDLDGEVVSQAERAIAAASVILLVVDAEVGPQREDAAFAKHLKKADVAPIVLVANKVDSPARARHMHEFSGLGLGEASPISALHGRGIGELLDLALMRASDSSKGGGVSLDPDAPRVAIVGRPNVGKSSLFNRLLGDNRSIVHPEPHTTRDSIVASLEDRSWVFVDTAGLRRRYRQGEDLEKYSVDRTRDAINESDLVLFVIDAAESLTTQDQRLAALLRDAGRGMVLVLNKWDAVGEERLDELDSELDRLLGFADWVPRLRTSATTGRGVKRILPTLIAVQAAYVRRVSTGALNRFVRRLFDRAAPPPVRGRTPSLRYVTQAETAPPTFVLFTSHRLQPQYLRYIERNLRQQWDFGGVPIRVESRSGGGRSSQRSKRRGSDHAERAPERR